MEYDLVLTLPCPFSFQSFGEYSKIMDTMYLNLLNVSYIDPTFDRCSTALQWLSVADNRSFQHILTPCVAAALHLLCRVEQKPDLTYTTRELTDSRYQLEANLGLAQKFSEGLSLQYRGSRSTDAIVRDTVPYSLWMLSAGEGSSALSRPATSVEILNKREQETFQSHLESLRALGMKYVRSFEKEGGYQDRRFANQSEMVLEPPIDRLVQFQELNCSPPSIRRQIPPAVSSQIN
jgi:chromosome transmission fidelity protein 18